MRLDADWLTALFAARPSLVSASGRSGLSAPVVVPPSSPSSSSQAAMPRRETISNTVKAVLTLTMAWTYPRSRSAVKLTYPPLFVRPASGSGPRS